MNKLTPKGVFAAALTPLKADGSLDLENELAYLDFLANRGCHGALLFGTTGEGPSFSLKERIELGRAALAIHQLHPEFMLLMGTGTPSLTETIEITRAAFDLGIPGVVVLPPYFNRKVSDDGLFNWFSEVIRKAIPRDGFLLGYHIPQMTGVPFSLTLLDRLKSTFPDTFVGIKNSWTEAEFARSVGDHFGPDLVVMAGFDNLFELNLSKHGSGCITASATLVSPVLRQVWDSAIAAHSEQAAANAAHSKDNDQDPSAAQAELNRIRAVMDSCPPAPALIKGLLAKWHPFPLWNVRPPLTPIQPEDLQRVADALKGPF